MKRPARDYTTLELSRLIADAVLKTRRRPRSRDNTRDPATNAVLDTLFDTGTWFCCGDTDEHGVTILSTERKLRP